MKTLKQIYEDKIKRGYKIQTYKDLQDVNREWLESYKASYMEEKGLYTICKLIEHLESEEDE